MRFIKFKYFYLSFVITIIFGCATNPVTGRKQANIISNDALFPESFTAYQETLKEEKLSNNQNYINQVNRVGNQIQKAVESFFISVGKPNYLDLYEWDYKVIESDQLNAWCMPGGKVAFYTGILPVCKDDQGVAVVMGHEIAHAIANHGAERISHSQIKSSIGNIGAIALGAGNVSSSTSYAILQAYGVGSNLGMLTYSRKHESEADEMGLIFMALAGFNPEEAPKFWKRMEDESSKSGQSSPPEFLSTHPHSASRIQDLNKLMPIAKKVYETGSIDPFLKYKGLK